jgi:hypothetical protein
MMTKAKMLDMKREIEYYDLVSLERELRNQNVRYQLAIKDGAVGSVISEVILRIAKLEEKIQNIRQEAELKLAYR